MITARGETASASALDAAPIISRMKVTSVPGVWSSGVDPDGSRRRRRARCAPTRKPLMGSCDRRSTGNDDGTQVEPLLNRSQLRSPPSSVMAPTTKRASTARSPTAILMLT